MFCFVLAIIWQNYKIIPKKSCECWKAYAGGVLLWEMWYILISVLVRFKPVFPTLVKYKISSKILFETNVLGVINDVITHRDVKHDDNKLSSLFIFKTYCSLLITN